MFKGTVMRQTQIKAASSKPKGRGRLPVPTLRHTLDKYLSSLEPFLLEDEARGGMKYESAYRLRKEWAYTFELGIGKLLQERLLALDKVSPYNWLDDNFWINKAYLEWRAPLLVNSNWWLAFCEDPLLPRSAIFGELNDNRAGTTFWQLRRAAWLTHRMLQFKQNTLDVTENSETNTAGPWLSENTSKMFNIARIPEPFCDTISEPLQHFSKNARSILVMIHDWCYSVIVYSPSPLNSTTLQLHPPAEIEARLRAVVLDVESRLEKGEKPLPVGVLSADDRERWAKNLQYLLSLSPTNKKSHQTMLHSVMGLSLEHTTYTILSTSPSTLATSYSTHTRNSSQNNLDSHLHMIRGTSQNVSNRFFDKPFTLIVDPSTRAGATGEHSPVDALVPSIVAEYGLIEGIDENAFNEGYDINDSDGPGFERLDWIGDDRMWKECDSAARRANAIMDNSDDSVLWYEKFGTDWITSVGHFKLSADAFIQMALQLAWYRQRGEFTATYETVLTRMFKHGRTETLRTFSRESRLWVLSMTDDNYSNDQRFNLLFQAISSHTRRTREGMTGRGFDRHLLGLRLLLRPLNFESAQLFEDELFERSSRWKLSTSGLSAGMLFKGTGFGAMFEDGYGINYLAAPQMVKFGIESKFSSPLTSTDSFKVAIATAMEDMYTLCEIGASSQATNVKTHL